MTPDTRLRHILARAAAPGERAAGGWLEPEPDATQVGSREAAWIQAVTNGDRDRFQALLRERRLEPEAFHRGLRDVRVLPGSPKPAWASGVLALAASFGSGARPVEPFRMRELAAAQELPPLVSPDMEWPLHAAFEPLLRPAAEELSQVVAASSLPIRAGAERQMLAHLAQRWSGVAVQVLMAEVDVADALTSPPRDAASTIHGAYLGGEQVSLEQWLDLWTAFPVLARLMAVAREGWSRFIRELVARLGEDASLLERTFLAPLEALAGFSAGAGDSHDGGRTVTVLTFGAGHRLLYKPRDLRISAVHAELLEVINSAAPSLPLGGRPVLPRPGYCWEGFVHEQECGSEEEVRRLFHRIGMHARLLVLLEASDFHHENVLAAGEQPVLIDLETLLTPRPRAAVPQPPLAQQAARVVQGTPIPSALITCKTTGLPGRRALEQGGICPRVPQESPYASLVFSRDAEGAGRLVRGFDTVRVRSATPLLRGSPVDPGAYAGEVIAGWGEMGGLLRQCADRLLAADGPLARAADCPVRFVYRQTQIYARLLMSSMTPACLRDAVARELVLERLWKGHLAHPGPVEIIHSEVDAVRGLDIPVFFSRPDSDAIQVEDGQWISGYFEGTPLQRVRERLRAPGEPPQDDGDPMRAALFVLVPGTARAAGGGTRSARASREVEPLAEAIAVGDFILKQALTSGDEVAWVGLALEPWCDTWHLGLLGGGVLAGVDGLAVVLAELGLLSGQRRFSDAALALLRARRGWLAMGARDEGPATGPLRGMGSTLYALRRCAAALGERSLPALEERSLAEVSGWVERAGREGRWGTLDGVARAELVLALSAGEAEAPLLSAAVELGTGLADALEQARGREGLPYVVDSAFLRGLPGPEQWVALAAMRLSRAARRPELDVPADVARAVFAPPPEELAGSGALLARLAAAAHAPALAEGAARAVALALERPARSSSELLESLEVAVTAAQCLDGAPFRQRAAELARLLVARRAAGDGWFPESLAPDRFNLSAVLGLGAVAHALCKVHAPGQIPSLRLLG